MIPIPGFQHFSYGAAICVDAHERDTLKLYPWVASDVGLGGVDAFGAASWFFPWASVKAVYQGRERPEAKRAHIPRGSTGIDHIDDRSSP